MIKAQVSWRGDSLPHLSRTIHASPLTALGGSTPAFLRKKSNPQQAINWRVQGDAYKSSHAWMILGNACGITTVEESLGKLLASQPSDALEQVNNPLGSGPIRIRSICTRCPPCGSLWFCSDWRKAASGDHRAGWILFEHRRVQTAWLHTDISREEWKSESTKWRHVSGLCFHCFRHVAIHIFHTGISIPILSLITDQYFI